MPHSPKAKRTIEHNIRSWNVILLRAQLRQLRETTDRAELEGVEASDDVWWMIDIIEDELSKPERIAQIDEVARRRATPAGMAMTEKARQAREQWEQYVAAHR